MEIDNLPEHVCNGLLVLCELLLENLELHPELGVGEVCIVQVLLQHAVLTLQVRSPEYKNQLNFPLLGSQDLFGFERFFYI